MKLSIYKTQSLKAQLRKMNLKQSITTIYEVLNHLLKNSVHLRTYDYSYVFLIAQLEMTSTNYHVQSLKISMDIIVEVLNHLLNDSVQKHIVYRLSLFLHTS